MESLLQCVKVDTLERLCNDDLERLSQKVTYLFCNELNMDSRVYEQS